MRATAVVLERLGELPALREVLIEPPAAGEVTVRIVATGLCHTDLAAIRDARACPVVLGHEGAGIVAAVGEGVQSPAVGDHVVICWQAKCGTCPNCANGRQHLCERVRATARPRVYAGDRPLAVLLNAGTLCQYVVVPATGAVPVRPDLPFERAALLGCAVATGLGAALNRPAPAGSDDVVIIGTGGVGLNVVQGCRLTGARRIIAVDRDVQRLELAERLGATTCITPGNDLTAAIQRATNGRGADHVFEATGDTQLMEAGVEMLARGGTLTLIGAAARDEILTIAPRSFLSRQLHLRGCIYGDIAPERDLRLFADWYADGRLELDALHTETITLADVPARFNRPQNAGAVRTVVSLAAQ
jgi:Zn-dependent alcohol dehydrogenase